MSRQKYVLKQIKITELLVMRVARTVPFWLTKNMEDFEKAKSLIDRAYNEG